MRLYIKGGIITCEETPFIVHGGVVTELYTYSDLLSIPWDLVYEVWYKNLVPNYQLRFLFLTPVRVKYYFVWWDLWAAFCDHHRMIEDQGVNWKVEGF